MSTTDYWKARAREYGMPIWPPSGEAPEDDCWPWNELRDPVKLAEAAQQIRDRVFVSDVDD